jgi:transcriptional regulator with XRE-family HTH domain
MIKNKTHPTQQPDGQAVLTKALLRVTSHWQMQDKELAEIIGVNPSVISRLRKGQSKAVRPDNHVGRLALLLIRAYRSLGAFLGNRFTIQQAWLREYHHAFNTTPLEAMRTPEGLVHVVQYLDAMRGAEG